VKFRKKPVVVEAEQWFPGKEVAGVIETGPEAAYVTTIQGRRVKLSPGEWVITEPDGIHHYPCDPDVFRKQFDPVE
jgi:hypothetical protein